MNEIERERVFLMKKIPPRLKQCKHIVIKVGDFFDSNAIDALKLKQKGDAFFLVKKEGDSARKRIEHSISIKKEEFEILWKTTVQHHEKIRYLYQMDDATLCEIDFYQGRLQGYVRIEVEFKTEKGLNAFKAPDWFGEEITQYNHDIHEELGKVTFKQMKERYLKKSLQLKRVSTP